MIPVAITPIPVRGLVACSVPVVPGTSETEPQGASELCAVDAAWAVGAAPICDVHLKVVCAIAEWDWPEILAEVGRDRESAEQPWGERERHSQEDAIRHRDHFMEATS